MSSTSSMPTLILTTPGSTPASTSCCSRELRVSGRRRVDDQRLRVADVGEMAGEVHRLDEASGRQRGRPCTTKLKTLPGPFGRYFCARSWCGCAGSPAQQHRFDPRVGVEPFGDGAGVVDVRLDAVRKRLDALREQERRVRRERRADVAQLLGAQPGEEGVLAEVARPLEAAVRRHGLRRRAGTSRCASRSGRSRRRRRRGWCRVRRGTWWPSG